jgi:hypothetical protein
MTPALRPMNLGEILDRTFQIYRSRFSAFVGIAWLPALAMMVLELANLFWWKLLPEPFGRPVFLGFTSQNLLYGLSLAHGRVFFNLLVWPSFAFVASNELFGKQVSLSGSLAACLARWRRWVGLAAACWSLQFLLPEVVVAGLLLGTVYVMFEVIKMDPNDPLHLGPLMFAGSLVVGWAAFQWIRSGVSLSAPAWVIENLQIRAAIRRSWKLSKGSRVRIFVACLMPEILGWVLMFTVSRILLLLRSACAFGVVYQFQTRLLGEIVPWHGWCVPYYAVEVIRLLAETAITTLLGPIYPIALTLFYYDQRIRKEGFDIERLMEAAGLNTAQPLPMEASEAATQRAD